MNLGQRRSPSTGPAEMGGRQNEKCSPGSWRSHRRPFRVSRLIQGFQTVCVGTAVAFALASWCSCGDTEPLAAGDLDAAVDDKPDGDVPGCGAGGAAATCTGEGGQIWIEHVEYAPSLVAEGEPELQTRLTAFFYREWLPIAAGGSECIDMVLYPRTPIALPEGREYVDVGDVTITGGGSTFPLERIENGVDPLLRPPHNILYQLVEPENPERPLVGGAKYSIEVSGSEEFDAIDPVVIAMLAHPISPPGAALEDMALELESSHEIEWTSDGDTFVPRVLLLRTDGSVVVVCSGRGGERGVTVTPEALAAFLEHEPSGVGRLMKMSSHNGSLWFKATPVRSNWATVQKFRIVD